MRRQEKTELRRRLAEQHRLAAYQVVHGRPHPSALAARQQLQQQANSLDAEADAAAAGTSGGAEAWTEFSIAEHLTEQQRQQEEEQEQQARKRPLFRRVWRYLKQAWTGVIAGSGNGRRDRGHRNVPGGNALFLLLARALARLLLSISAAVTREDERERVRTAIYKLLRNTQFALQQQYMKLFPCYKLAVVRQTASNGLFMLLPSSSSRSVGRSVAPSHKQAPYVRKG